MKVTLKKVKTFTGHDGMGLNADVYVDGVKTFFIFDGATGGEPEHTVFNKEKYKELADYAKSIPEYPLVIGGEPYLKDGVQVMMGSDIDTLVNQAFEEIEKEKFNKKMIGKMKTHILWGDETSYRCISWKNKSIQDLLSYQKGKEAIQKELTELKTKYPEGRLLNTNIPNEIIIDK